MGEIGLRLIQKTKDSYTRQGTKVDVRWTCSGALFPINITFGVNNWEGACKDEYSLQNRKNFQTCEPPNFRTQGSFISIKQWNNFRMRPSFGFCKICDTRTLGFLRLNMKAFPMFSLSSGCIQHHLATTFITMNRNEIPTWNPMLSLLKTIQFFLRSFERRGQGR